MRQPSIGPRTHRLAALSPSSHSQGVLNACLDHRSRTRDAPSVRSAKCREWQQKPSCDGNLAKPHISTCCETGLQCKVPLPLQIRRKRMSQGTYSATVAFTGHCLGTISGLGLLRHCRPLAISVVLVKYSGPSSRFSAHPALCCLLLNTSIPLCFYSLDAKLCFLFPFSRRSFCARRPTSFPSSL